MKERRGIRLIYSDRHFLGSKITYIWVYACNQRNANHDSSFMSSG